MNLSEPIFEQKREVDGLSASVLRVLLYYDLFNYPLTSDEVVRHCSQPHCTLERVKECLDFLCSEHLIFRFGNFYSLRKEVSLFERRLKGNHEAEKIMNKARKRSSFIAKFPFVRCVCISGSLSKHYFDETTDIDFFVITEPNRLWLCRSLLILYKKIFLLNNKKYFCVNYFIDSKSLEIRDKNIFTATEIITLLPLYNYELYEDFFEANSWIKNFYPNSSPRKNLLQFFHQDNWLKRVLERITGAIAGSWLDRYFHSMTLRHWKKKFSDLEKEEFEVNMRSEKNVSKHHPQGFQFRVLKLFDENCRAFEERHQLTLS